MSVVTYNTAELIAEIESYKRVGWSASTGITPDDRMFNLGLDTAVEIIASKDNEEIHKKDKEPLISIIEFVNLARKSQMVIEDSIISEGDDKERRHHLIMQHKGIELCIMTAIKSETKKFVRRNNLVIDELISPEELKQEIISCSFEAKRKNLDVVADTMLTVSHMIDELEKTIETD